MAHLQDGLKELLAADISVRCAGTPEEVMKTLYTHLVEKGLSESVVLQDMSRLLGTFREITGVNTFRVLLTTVHNNMCKQFHTDINDLRLLCTYWGKGTMWAAEAKGDRDAFLIQEKGGHVNPHPDSIRQADAGDILILKGALYPNGQPVIHKSPAIESAGGVRLLFRIDTNERL